MNDGRGAWWLGGDRTWHRGTPPVGWRQGGDGRWHAPDHTTDELPMVGGAPWTDPPVVPTEPLAVEVAPARHLAPDPRGPRGPRGSRRPPSETGGTSFDLPTWMKVVVPALVAVIVLATAGVLVTASRGADPDPEQPSGELGAAGEASGSGTAAPDGAAGPAPIAADAPAGQPTGPSPSPDSTVTPPATGTPATTTPPVPPTTDPAASGDPLAACAPGQRAAIERGNHTWDWYVARFDQDGDGILCT
jgi:hypothetical protein